MRRGGSPCLLQLWGEEFMSGFDRRKVVASLAALGVSPLGAAFAQSPDAQRTSPIFGLEDVQRRARELASAPQAPVPAIPDALKNLDFNAWRDINFRSERTLTTNAGSLFRLQMFHLGAIFRQPVTVNVIRDGIATPVPYSANLFDYGRTKFERPLPVNLGFAGFRLHYPLNDPRSQDELIAFLGGCQFRFLGRGQRYGLAARALNINAGTAQEETPFFREFWIETFDPAANHAVVYALLDSESLTGAFRFAVWPGVDTAIEVSASIYARKAGLKLGIAPMYSMFLHGENQPTASADFRPEVHNSDGMLMQSRAGEWLWRPLRNPASPEASGFSDKDVRGFGLLQRDRNFEHYQDLDRGYEQRPGYYVEAAGNWGEGQVMLLEAPSASETRDNIFAFWAPNESPEPGKPYNFAYRMSAALGQPQLSPVGRALYTRRISARPAGASSSETNPNIRRFMVEFGEGELAYYLNDSASVELVATASTGAIASTTLAPNPHTKGFRAIIDVTLEAGQSTQLRAYLRSGSQRLTETWAYAWTASA